MVRPGNLHVSTLRRVPGGKTPMKSVRKALFAAMFLSVIATERSDAQVADPRPANDPNQKPAFAGQTDAPEKKANVAFDVVQVAEGLENPWSLAFLPDGKMLVTERPGRLRVLTADGKLSEPVTGLPELVATGQGGLLDVVLDPGYAKNNIIYVCFSQPKPNANNTAVARG